MLIKRFLNTKSTKIKEVFIVSHARTPLGAFQGSLMTKSATDLGAAAIKNAVERIQLPKEAVEDVMMGCVLQGGLGQAPARQAGLGAGLSKTTPATTVNKVCASGMKAIMLSAANLGLGLKNVAVAGGMESLSNSPFYLPRGQTPYGEVKLRDACHYDGLTDAYTSWHMGKCAEKTASDLHISKEEQNNYAQESLKRLENALENGIFKGEIYPIQTDKDMVDRDDNMNPYDASQMHVMPTPWGQSVTRGSASKLADGAAACVLMNNEGLMRYNAQPMAKILAFVDSAQDPIEWPTSPALGISKILEDLNLKSQDIAAFEINEAFAVVVLAIAKLCQLDLGKINVHGGAIGLGHPFGMSGARITNHLVHTLKSGEIGIATLCNGGGGASTIAIEKL